jgi:hypothetical protein
MMKSACRRDDHRDSVPDRQHVARTSEQEAPMLRTPILALAAAGILAAASAGATEYTLFANLCLPDLGGRSADACPARALLNLPQAWPRDGPAAFVLGTAAVREWRLAVLCEAIGLAAGTPATESEPLAWADGCYTTLLGRPRPGSPMVAKLRR